MLSKVQRTRIHYVRTLNTGLYKGYARDLLAQSLITQREHDLFMESHKRFSSMTGTAYNIWLREQRARLTSTPLPTATPAPRTGSTVTEAQVSRAQAQIDALNKDLEMRIAREATMKAAATKAEMVHRGYGESFAIAESIDYPGSEKIPMERQCQRGERYNIHFWQSCDAGYTKKFDLAQNYYCECGLSEMVQELPTPTTIPTSTTSTPPAECPKGLFYDAKWYLQCATGYIEYSLKGHNKCICSARMAEGKAQLDTLYAKENGNGDGDGDGIFAGFKDLGKIANYIPVLILGAVVIAVIGMFKK